jgi:hypothetical protein
LPEDRAERIDWTGAAKSIVPSLICERRGIEFLPMAPPLRHVPVHDCEETLIMMSLDQMREFVDDDVLEHEGGSSVISNL